MRKTSSGSKGLGLLLLVCAFVLGEGTPTWSQDRRVAMDQVVAHPRGLPQLPPQGAWGEVINATPEADGTHKHFFLQVPANLRTAREAVAWTYGMRADAYDQLVMRT